MLCALIQTQSARAGFRHFRSLLTLVHLLVIAPFILIENRTVGFGVILSILLTMTLIFFNPLTDFWLCESVAGFFLERLSK